MISLVAARIHKLVAQLPYLPRTFALVWAAARGWTVLWGALLVMQGLLPVGTVYLSRSVVDQMLAAVRSGGDWSNVRPALLSAALIAAVVLATEVLRSLTGYVRTAHSELVQDHISALIHQKSASIDLAFYDSPDFYDHLHRARTEASYRPVALLENAGSLLQNGITLAAMAAVLLPFGWWLPLVLLAGTLPALIVALRHTLRQHEWRRRITPDERRTWYFDWLLTAPETASEMRLFNLAGHFEKAYATLRQRLRGEKMALTGAQSAAQFGAGAAALAVSSGAMAWMMWRAVRGLATLGDLALFYQALQLGLGLMRSLLEGLAQLYGNILFLGSLFEFLGLQPRITSVSSPLPVPALRDGIRFRNVVFRYPGSRGAALENFDLSIPAGRLTAVVGTNGAGKSTLVKLLARFYDPDEGWLEWDGLDLRGFSPEALRRRIAILFQQSVHYNATLRDNIAFGDLKRTPGAEEVAGAAQQAGVEAIVGHLPEGYDSLLGKYFDRGAELSTGEWQRIALARALYRQAPVLVLDEPTSAMDPWAELAWLRRLREVTQGRTVLIITHRLTTARFADVIHVMERGRIVESGTHEQLLHLSGRYCQAWEDQRRQAASAGMA